MTNLITATHKQVGALIIEGQRKADKAAAALEKAQQKHGAIVISFNQELANAGAISTDFTKGTASSPEVFYFYKECVAKALPVAQQKVLAGKGGDEKGDIIRLIGAKMGAIKGALARRESLKAGTATDKRTKAAKAAKKVTASAKGTDTPAPNMAPESGEVTEAKGILPPTIRDPRLTELFNKAAQMDIVEQAQLAVLIYDAIKLLAKRTK